MIILQFKIIFVFNKLIMHKVFNNMQSEVNTDSELTSAENNWEDIWQLLLKRPSQKC